ncbi:FAD-binding protein [Mycobacterium hodleri]|uniref:FAD-binding protein n=2 Tax=Mycolicibacterium hodleri TaxID=49897 RepID=A0A502EHC2_9MYCO|nr:FAD-binding protein [Mycolicibacterium hodleri]
MVESEWDVVTDCVVVGSGGGSMCAVLAADHAGLQTLIIEKADVVGGSTAMSGGILWLPDNPVSRAAGVVDSHDDALRYFAAVVGDEGPSTSPQRTEAFLAAIEPMVEFLAHQGVPFRHCEGYSDYYDDRPGGKARGRSIETELFSPDLLGPWLEKFRISETLPPIPLRTSEVARATVANRTLRGAWTVAKVAGRYAAAKLSRREVRGSGAALQGWMMLAAIRAEIPIWTGTPVVDIVLAEGRAVGVVAERHGKLVRVRARCGVLLNSGGFSHNETMRKEFGRSPASTAWTVANPGDTGEVIQAAMMRGAAVDLMDEAWWIPTSVLPDGSPLYIVYERAKPHGIMVDRGGFRYVNEGASYMEVGRTMYERNKTVPAIPSWWIMDAHHRSRYLWGLTPGGFTPRNWISSGYMKKANSIEELARLCKIDPTSLRTTVENFNSNAVKGIDPDFHKGERAYDRYYGDPRQKPNPCLGPVDKPPFYAVAVYPGDVGTCGGLLTDEDARVQDTDGQVIPGLYATGNCTASVMGRTYPGAGASIGASFVFGWRAAQHMIVTKSMDLAAASTSTDGQWQT